MASAIGASPAYLTLEMTVVDFRGQKKLLRIPLLGATADSGVLSIVDNYDAVSNAQITEAFLISRRAITGMKGGPLNALERNISEAMALTFAGTNSNGKPVARGVSVYAMKAAIENNDGSPVVRTTNANLDSLTDSLAGALAYLNAAGSWVGSLAYDIQESHHYTAGDIVDTK